MRLFDSVTVRPSQNNGSERRALADGVWLGVRDVFETGFRFTKARLLRVAVLTVVLGATPSWADTILEYDAVADGDASDNVWTDLQVTRNLDLTGVMYETVSSSTLNVTGAMRFNGTDKADLGESIQSLPGSFVNYSRNSWTTEIVFKPSDMSGNEILWEHGGGGPNGKGSSLVLTDNVLEFRVRNGSTGDLEARTTLTNASDFLHVVAVWDRFAVGEDEILLYVNGAITDTHSGFGVDDSAGTNFTGIGSRTGVLGNSDDLGGWIFDAGSYQTLDGWISHWRFYDEALGATGVIAKYDAVAVPEPNSTLFLGISLATLALGRRRRLVSPGL